jgi:tetratricopeptide (TPR) repeat protein
LDPASTIEIRNVRTESVRLRRGARGAGLPARGRTLDVGSWNPSPGMVAGTRMARRGRLGMVAALGLAWLATLPAGWAQQPGNVILDSNEQLFCVLAARTAAAGDASSGGETGRETRAQVRAYLAKKKISVLPELRAFFDQHRVVSDAGIDLGQYVSLALLLGPPPDFRFAVPQSDLPPDAKALAGLIPLLKTFYGQGDLINLWAEVHSRYEQEVERYSDIVRRSIERSDAYLRSPSGAYLGRTYTIYLSLLGPAEQVQARIYGQNYYLVITPSKEPKLAEIRHQYLHFLLDPLAVKYAPQINQKAELKALARQAPQLASDFKQDFPLLVTECLIRAVELRMDKRPAAVAEESVRELTASGLVLVPYFYSALENYEKQDAAMSVVYREMIEGINVSQEKARLESVKFAPAEVAGTANAAPVLSEEDRLLNQGDNLISEGRFREAREAFQSVLATFDPQSERALFGMAVVNSNLRKPDLAEEYFQKTLEAAHDLRIVTWSHIYLGRLYDLKGKRKEALNQYRAASLTAPAYPDALRAAQNGLERPFGSKP